MISINCSDANLASLHFLCCSLAHGLSICLQGSVCVHVYLHADVCVADCVCVAECFPVVVLLVV